MSSKANKISKKKKYNEYEKVMHMVYLYLEKKGLTKDFQSYCKDMQEGKEIKHTKFELLVKYIKSWFL